MQRTLLILVDADFGVLARVMRYAEIIAIPLRHQNASFRAERRWNFGQELVVVGIFLLEYIKRPVAREIYAFVLSVINCVIDQSDSGQLGDDLTIIRIHHNQLTWLSRDN